MVYHGLTKYRVIIPQFSHEAAKLENYVVIIQGSHSNYITILVRQIQYVGDYGHFSSLLHETYLF